MIPIVWKQFTCNISGGICKFVECEQCDQKYVYQMTRTVQGEGSSLYFLDNEGAQARAQERAQAQLQRQLTAGCDPVPCPKCGWYQRQMVEKLRRHHREWIYWTGILLLFPFIACALVGWLMLATESAKPLTAIFVLAAAGMCFATAIGLLLYRKYAGRKLEPNNAPLAERLRIATVKAEAVNDFEAWLQAHGIQLAPPPETAIRDLSAGRSAGTEHYWTCSDCTNLNPPTEPNCMYCQPGRFWGEAGELVSRGGDAVDAEPLPATMPKSTPPLSKVKASASEYWKQTGGSDRCQECGVINAHGSLHCKACGFELGGH